MSGGSGQAAPGYLDTTYDGRLPPDMLSNPSFAGTTMKEGMGGTMVSQPKTYSDGWTAYEYGQETPISLRSPNSDQPPSYPGEPIRSFEERLEKQDSDLQTVPMGNTHKLPELNLDMLQKYTSQGSLPVQPPYTKRRYSVKTVELKKDEDGCIGITFDGPIITEVEKGSPAEAAGVEPWLRIIKVNKTVVCGNMGSNELLLLLEKSASPLSISLSPLHNVQNEDVTSEFNWTEGDDSSINLNPSFNLSAQQAVYSIVALIFVLSPVLVLLLALVAAGPLALILEWPFVDAFWVCCSVVVSPLGGAPVLKEEEHVNLGGRIYITVLAGWCVGVFGVMQLLLAPGIEPIFTWTIEMRNKMAEKPLSPRSPVVRAMSAWRLRNQISPNSSSPRALSGRVLRRPASRASRSPWGRRSSISRSSRPPDTARSCRSTRSVKSPQSAGEDYYEDDSTIETTATGDAL
eukprot:TRINITY_DN1848_c0_g1_i1.p1 TRINITY_DN1848_c0_g1~~TRINITY_DN1848_c0_g1_i1.p1  ORF type:complete len:460 (+),score=68.35 TRINITY_DN1848_c0_g1_i1:105-1484(+)